ncbi:MAG: O-antigen ligase family protein, partial [Pseudomonadota bacterium]
MLYTNEVVVLPVDGQYFQEQRMGEYPGRLIRGAIGFGVLLGYLFFRFKNTLQSLSVFFSVAGAILLFGFASMFWSVDPAYTVQKAISYGFCIIYPALLIRAFGLSESLWLIWAVGAVILIASAIFAVIGSDFALMKGAHEGLWRGFFSHKNKFGPFALWMLLLSIALPPTDKVRQALVLTVKVVAVVSIVFSGSATALMLLVLSYSVYVVFKILLQSNVTPILGSLSIVFAIVTGVTLIATFTPMVLELMGRDLTLTGRVPLWQAAIPHTLAHPFGFGFGIGASEAALTDIRTATGWDVAPNVHNGFIELALSLGWAAVVVFYSWLASNFIFINSTRKLFFQYSAV